MATLPSYVKVLREGFSEQRGKGAIVRSQMESGPAKQRRVETRTMVTRPVSLLIETRENYLLFVAWVKADISMGADWFDWVDPVDGVTKSARFTGGEYEAVPLSDRVWRINATLETWE